MQFLGVGWQEIALVVIVALVVVGPERLPNVAYQVGKAVRTMQSYARAVRSEFSEEIGYLEEQYKTVKGEVSSASEAIRQEQQKFATEMRSVTGEVQSQVHGIGDSLSVSNVVNIHDGSRVASPPDSGPASVFRTDAFTPVLEPTPPPLAVAPSAPPEPSAGTKPLLMF